MITVFCIFAIFKHVQRWGCVQGDVRFGREMAPCHLAGINLSASASSFVQYQGMSMPSHHPTSFFSHYDVCKMPWPGHTRASMSVGIGRESNFNLHQTRLVNSRPKRRGVRKFKFKLPWMLRNRGKRMFVICRPF